MTAAAIASLVRIERATGRHAPSHPDPDGGGQFRCGPWWGRAYPDGRLDMWDAATGRVAGFVDLPGGGEGIAVVGARGT